MPTVFRFAIQTTASRFSEVWSFFCNEGRGDVYATRTSMSKWLKISFHNTCNCHVKTYDLSSRPFGNKEFSWKSNDPETGHPVHLLRVIYDISRQRADFRVDSRVTLSFEQLIGRGSIYLDVYTIQSNEPLTVNLNENVVSAHHLAKNKWVYFKIGVGPELSDPQGPVNCMTLHMGQYIADKNGSVIGLKNPTAVWFSTPKEPGTLTISEQSWNYLSIDELDKLERNAGSVSQIAHK